MLPHLSSGLHVEITKGVQGRKKLNMCKYFLFSFLRTANETNYVNEHVLVSLLGIAPWFHSALSSVISRIRVAPPVIFFLCILSNARCLLNHLTFLLRIY